MMIRVDPEARLLERWTAVDAYFAGRLHGADPDLDAALANSAAAGLPAIAVSPSQGRLLFILAKALGARRILELGTLGGYSGICLARALPPDGRLVTIEKERAHADVARANFEHAAVASLIDLRIGAALEILPALQAEGGGAFDLVFIDADKPHYRDYLGWAVRLCRPGSLIVADNVVREGAVIDPGSEDESVIGVRRFVERVSQDPQLTATAIQTVGDKGYDGLAVILVGTAG
ncbi:MAG: O-methyltransferase [Vicinamibacterales bacterium]